MEYRNKNCIVAGGAGFLGSGIAEELINRGATVVIVDNLDLSDETNVPNGCKLIKRDIRNKKSLEIAAREFSTGNNGVDYLFNYATPPSIINYRERPLEVGDIMITGFMNSVKFATQNNARLVYPSSSSLYKSDTPHREDDVLPTDSINAYGKSKLACELIHKSQDDLNAVGLRTFVAYGPGEAHKGDYASVVTIFISDILRGKSPVVFGDGSQSRDFIYVEDVINATLSAGANANEEIINIGSGNAYTFNTVIDIINDILGSDIQPEYTDAPESYLEMTEADTSIMDQYYPETKYSFREGVSELANHLNQKIK